MEISREDFAVLFIDRVHRSYPFALAVWVIAGAGTLNHAKVLCDQLVRGQMIFLHVGFPVGVVL